MAAVHAPCAQTHTPNRPPIVVSRMAQCGEWNLSLTSDIFSGKNLSNDQEKQSLEHTKKNAGMSFSNHIAPERAAGIFREKL